MEKMYGGWNTAGARESRSPLNGKTEIAPSDVSDDREELISGR